MVTAAILSNRWFAILPWNIPISASSSVTGGLSYPEKGYFEESIDEHAGEQETSVMMHYRPELVHLLTAGEGIPRPWNMESLNNKTGWMPRNWKNTTVDTGIGNPEKSTAEKGEKYMNTVREKIVQLLVELKNI